MVRAVCISMFLFAIDFDIKPMGIILDVWIT